MITIISGTNRPGSKSLQLANHYQKVLEEKGVKTNLISLCSLPATFINSDLYGQRSAAFQVIQDQVTAAQKFVFVIGEYNGSFPGILKTFVDACKFPESFAGKKAAMVGLADGAYGNIRGVEHFSGISLHIGLNILPARVHIPRINSVINEEGHFHEGLAGKMIEDQALKFIAF